MLKLSSIFSTEQIFWSLGGIVSFEKKIFIKKAAKWNWDQKVPDQVSQVFRGCPVQNLAGQVLGDLCSPASHGLALGEFSLGEIWHLATFGALALFTLSQFNEKFGHSFCTWPKSLRPNSFEPRYYIYVWPKILYRLMSWLLYASLFNFVFVEFFNSVDPFS